MAGLPSYLLAICFAISACFLTYHLTVSSWQREYGIETTDLRLMDQRGSRVGTKLRGVGLASGIAIRPPDRTPKVKKRKRFFHTAMTCNGSPYTKWQSRVMYYFYRKYKDDPESEMGGFTRVQHSGHPDNIMQEVPTFVVDPLPDDKDYVVLNRPWAFVQWLEKASIEEELSFADSLIAGSLFQRGERGLLSPCTLLSAAPSYIFMAEPDHIITKPIPNLATEDMPAAFPFFYITPKEEEKYLRRWYPESRGPITNIDPIGNSPSIIKKDVLKKIAPLWMNVSLEFMSDPVVVKQFDWVLEMYAYATASAILGQTHILRKDFMIQPPWDTTVGDAYIIHYTYGQDFDLEGHVLPGKVGPWHFDKRDYNGAPPRNLSYPPKGSAPSVFELIRRINEATSSLDWVAGAE